MTRPRRLAAFLCLVALWLQAMAPALAAAMPRDTDAFVICAQAKAGTPVDQKAPAHHQACDRCVLCHASSADVAAEWRPVFTTLDFPIASPLRWALRDPIALDRRQRGAAAPRGPPRLV